MLRISVFSIMMLIFSPGCNNQPFTSDEGLTNTSSSPHVKLKSINIGDVKWTDGFWSEKFDLIHKVGIPNMWNLLKDSAIMHSAQNFRIAAGLEPGDHVGTKWLDGDTYKWLEAVAYVYADTRDQELNHLMDEVIDLIGKAQEPDGYINTYMTIGGRERFQNTNDHELYNMGHLMTAGCIHYQATGKKSLLDIAVKAGDCLDSTFSDTNKHFLGYSSIMGLVDLYRTTGEKKYLDLADRFVTMYGTGNVAFRRTSFSDGRGTDLKQDRTPLREEEKAVGHSVRGNYLYCGATDVFSETGDEKLFNALDRIWTDIRTHKMYITGASTPMDFGISSAGDKVHEAFGREYVLPNIHGYNETCANIGSAMWNWRMLNITGEARFADMAELILFNSVLSSISIDGKHFFYANRLQRIGDIPPPKRNEPTRWTHQMGFCCPPNIIRTIAKVNTWAYSVSEKSIWVNLYGGNKLETAFSDGDKIQLTQETDYPWDGQVKIIIQSPQKKEYSLMLRIPDWANDPTCKVNGRPVDKKLEPGTYLNLSRVWESGDIIELNLPMIAQLIEAHPAVEEDRNLIAVKRGPVVYCLESPDLPEGIRVTEIMIPRDVKLRAVHKEGHLGGVTVLQGKAYYRPQDDWQGKLYKPLKQSPLKSMDITLIPYFAWSNRGVSEMTVWMPVTYK